MSVGKARALALDADPIWTGRAGPYQETVDPIVAEEETVAFRWTLTGAQGPLPAKPRTHRSIGIVVEDDRRGRSVWLAGFPNEPSEMLKGRTMTRSRGWS
jgi:hypothetical protein